MTKVLERPVVLLLLSLDGESAPHPPEPEPTPSVDPEKSEASSVDGGFLLKRFLVPPPPPVAPASAALKGVPSPTPRVDMVGTDSELPDSEPSTLPRVEVDVEVDVLEAEESVCDSPGRPDFASTEIVDNCDVVRFGDGGARPAGLLPRGGVPATTLASGLISVASSPILDNQVDEFDSARISSALLEKSRSNSFVPMGHRAVANLEKWRSSIPSGLCCIQVSH